MSIVPCEINDYVEKCIMELNYLINNQEYIYNKVLLTPQEVEYEDAPEIVRDIMDGVCELLQSYLEHEYIFGYVSNEYEGIMILI